MQVWDICLDILHQPHTLIAGCTGSGKSVLINSIVWSAIANNADTKSLVLIDPKRVELVRYKQLPHTLRYASEPPQIIAALTFAENEMEARYRYMQRNGLRKWPGGDIYVVIDELADIMTTIKKEATPHICRIAQLGRAANVHIIAATQRPTREVITGQIKVNIDCRIALRVPTAQDSRNIIGVSGAELLPRFGVAYMVTPDGTEKVEVPFTDDAEIQRRVDFWTKKPEQEQEETQKPSFLRRLLSFC